MTETERKEYQKKADVLKALAHPTRLWIAAQLEGGECCVCEFVDAVGVDYSTVSKHLAVMKEVGLVADEKRGKQVFYRLNVPCVLNFMSCIESVLQADDSCVCVSGGKK